MLSWAALAIFGGVIPDVVAPIAFWCWVFGAPIVGGAAWIANRRRGKRGHAWVNGVLLAGWAVGVMAALLIH
jgi:hypothetical protein